MRNMTLALVVVIFAAVAPASAGDRLHRRLHLPKLAAGAACPVTRVNRHVDWETINIFGGSGVGAGPVYAPLGRVDFPFLEDHGWWRQKMFWYVDPRYRGPVLIRGARIDAPGQLRFGETGRVLEMRIPVRSQIAWTGQPKGSRGAPSYLRVHADGCYAVQIDGTRFSKVLVFAATTGDGGAPTS